MDKDLSLGVPPSGPVVLPQSHWYQFLVAFLMYQKNQKFIFICEFSGMAQDTDSLVFKLVLNSQPER